MDKPFYLIAIMFIFVVCWLLQEENQLWDQQRQVLKAANNKSVHAALFAAEDLNSGIVSIPDNSAFKYFREALQANLGLDEFLNPKPGSPVYSAVRIVHFEVIDEQSGRSFPFLYENSTYNLTKYIRGPSIVAVIEVDRPSLMQGSHAVVRVPSIYEYARSE